MDKEDTVLAARVALEAVQALKEATRVQEIAALAVVYAAACSDSGTYNAFEAAVVTKDFAKLVGITLPE